MSTPADAAREGARQGDGRFGVQRRLEADEVGLSDRETSPFTLLKQPQVTTHPDGTVVTNMLAEPVTDEDGIYAYSSRCTSFRPGEADSSNPEVPRRSALFQASVMPRDGDAHMQTQGVARSEEEGWDRAAEFNNTWADTYDHRPSMLAQGSGYNEARARRLGAADRLNEAVSAVESLPSFSLSLAARRRAKEARRELDEAIEGYFEAYPV